jgi:hypothetical protein
MSRLALLSLALAAGWPSQAFADRSEPRPVERFEQVQVSAGIRLVARTADKQAVEASASEKDLPELVTEVKDGTLHIHWKSKTGWFSSHGGATVTVVGPALRGVEASGGAHAILDDVAGDAVKLEASGGGELEIKRLVGKKLDLALSGGSRARIEGGTVDSAQLEASGGASVRAKALAIHQATLAGSGGSTMELGVDQKLSASLSGGSRATVHGKPQVERRDTSGGAELIIE